MDNINSIAFKTVPNQKVIEIGPKAAYDQNNIYCRINKDVLLAAMRDLKEPTLVNGKKTVAREALGLFIYLASNANGYKFALSQQAVYTETGIEKDAYQNAVNFLIAKGYLVQQGDGSNFYVFHEMPLKCETDTL